jgi:hypothetical protein
LSATSDYPASFTSCEYSFLRYTYAPKMCYQVVERYSICRCLYYKSAMEPCAAHGQRGHTVQQKTVLVGYVCSTHQKTTWEACASASEVQDVVDDDSDDRSDDEDSVFSTSITLSRATSFVASEEQDTVAEVLRVLLGDPLLN